MRKKVIWLVNEYNGPYVGSRTRQTVLSQLLEQRGYEVYIIAGSSDYKSGENSLKKGEPFRNVEYDGAHFIIIRTNRYRRSPERVLISLQFQKQH